MTPKPTRLTSPPRINPRPVPGFSLTEIFVALAILSIIFAVALSTLLDKREQGSKIVKFKEALVTISDITRQGMASSELTVTNNADYYLSKMNALQSCPALPVTNGCMSGVPGSPADVDGAGLVLPDGGQIMMNRDDMNYATLVGEEWLKWFVIDYNGDRPPNEVGQDQLWIAYSYGSDPVPAGIYTNTPILPGTMQPIVIHPDPAVPAAALAANAALYNKIVGK